jgi:hypothetical protein
MPYGARENLFSRFPQTLAQHSEMNSPDNRNRVGVALLVLRVTIFLVMLIWMIDKFVRPSHAISVYEHFYFLRGLGPAIICSIGVAELVLLIGFVIGFAPRVTYGLVMLLPRSLNFFVFPPVSPSVRRTEHSLLRCLADARRVFYSLLPARSRYSF